MSSHEGRQPPDQYLDLGIDLTLTPGQLAASNQLLVESGDGPPLDWIPDRSSPTDMKRARFGLSRNAPDEVVTALQAKKWAFDMANYLSKMRVLFGMPDATVGDCLQESLERYAAYIVDCVILPTDPEWRDPQAVDYTSEAFFTRLFLSRSREIQSAAW